MNSSILDSGVPDFSGGTLDAAKDRLKQLKLSVGTVTREKSRQASGTILHQTPSAGTEVDEGTTVDFVLAESTGQVVPNSGSTPAIYHHHPFSLNNLLRLSHYKFVNCINF